MKKIHKALNGNPLWPITVYELPSTTCTICYELNFLLYKRQSRDLPAETRVTYLYRIVSALHCINVLLAWRAKRITCQTVKKRLKSEISLLLYISLICFLTINDLNKVHCLFYTAYQKFLIITDKSPTLVIMVTNSVLLL